MRNREHDRTKPVVARIAPLGGRDRTERSASGQYLARCGRCGQSLWTVRAASGPIRACLNDQDIGWRFDPVSRVWFPTERSLAQRRAARERVRSGDGADRERQYDRDMLRITGYRFGRRKGRLAPIGVFATEQTHPDGPPRFGYTAVLPALVACPQCATINRIEDPEMDAAE
jgi:hypothetical protein